MARDIVLDIIAKVQSREVERLAAELDKAADSTDKASKSASKHRDTLEVLDREIATARTRVRELGEEFRKTGSVDAFDNLRQANKELRALERVHVDLSRAITLGDPQQTGRDFGDLFSKGVVGFFSDPAVLAPAAPLIGAALDAAAVGGIGTVGLAAGIAAQFRDPVIQQAGAEMVGGIMDDLQSASRGLDTEILGGIGRLETAFDNVTPNLRRGFDALSPALGSLTAGVEGLIEKAGPGVEHALEAAAPILQELGNDLPGVGDAIGIFLDELSAGSESGAHSLHDVIQAFDVLLIVLGAVTDILASDYDLFVGMATFNWDKIKSGFKSLENLKDVGHDAKAAADGTQQFDTKLNAVGADAPAAGAAVSEFAASMQLFDDSALDAQRSAMRFADSESQLVDTIKKGKKHWEKNADTVRQYRELYLDAEQAAEQHAQALLKSGASAEEAAAAYQQDMTNLDAMLKKAGLTDQQIAMLSKDLDNVAKVRRGSVDISINVKGDTALIGNQGQFLISGKGIKLERYGGIEYAAQGMITDRPTVVFGEAGVGEAFIPESGISEDRAASLIGTTMSWHPQAAAALMGARLAGIPAPAPVVNVAAPVVRVYIGDEEITERVQVMIEHHDQRTAAAVTGGVRL